MASPSLASFLSALAVLAASPTAVPAPTLTVGPAQRSGAVPLVDPPKDPQRQADYQAALEANEQANIDVNKEPEANLPALMAAIDELTMFAPEIASDASGREALDLSMLNLARALLLTGDKQGASLVMDDALRAARGRKLPVKRFGPTLVDFHNERRQALEDQGTGTLQVRCKASCRVIIDEQPASTVTEGLLLGSYRVWVEAADPESDLEPVRVEVDLLSAGTVGVVDYPSDAFEECPPPPEPIVIEPPPPPPKRILPRWAEIGVAVIGVGAVAAGGVLLGLDGKCPRGLDPIADAPDCPQIYEGTASGLVALGVGSALTITGGVLLAIDEVRVGKERGRQAMLTWRMRF